MTTRLRSLIHVFVILLPLSLTSQTTVTNNTFPQPGDTLRTISSVDVGSFDKTLVGENIEWDLRDVGTGIFNQTIFSEPSEGSAANMFPDADLLDQSTAQEIYYETFNNKIVEIGRSGLDPVLNAIELTFQNEGEAILRRAPMSYQDVYDDESKFLLAASADIVPDSILGPLASSVDSLRLTVETVNDDEVDAWGTMRLPGADYDVLRVKRETTTNVTLEAKVLLLGWVTVDPSNPLFSALGDLLELLGESTVTSYRFFADGHKEIIADISEDTDGNVIAIQYKGSPTTSTEDVISPSVNLSTYPNPTYGNITFDMSNMPKGDYTIVVYNVIGKEMWSAQIDGARKYSTNLSHLRRGTYLYSVLDEKGRKLTTRRLMLITP